jgi:endonuclease YncB( thermonuclease family)
MQSYDSAFVERVMDGNTFETDKCTITLDRVYVPPITIPEGRLAKQKLVSKIAKRIVTYKITGIVSYGVVLAEVWVDKININNWMGEQGYDKNHDWRLGPEWTRWVDT